MLTAVSVEYDAVETGENKPGAGPSGFRFTKNAIIVRDGAEGVRGAFVVFDEESSAAAKRLFVLPVECRAWQNPQAKLRFPVIPLVGFFPAVALPGRIKDLDNMRKLQVPQEKLRYIINEAWNCAERIKMRDFLGRLLHSSD